MNGNNEWSQNQHAQAAMLRQQEYANLGNANLGKALKAQPTAASILLDARERLAQLNTTIATAKGQIDQALTRKAEMEAERDMLDKIIELIGVPGEKANQ